MKTIMNFLMVMILSLFIFVSPLFSKSIKIDNFVDIKTFSEETKGVLKHLLSEEHVGENLGYALIFMDEINIIDEEFEISYYINVEVRAYGISNVSFGYQKRHRPLTCEIYWDIYRINFSSMQWERSIMAHTVVYNEKGHYLGEEQNLTPVELKDKVIAKFLEKYGE